MDIYNGDIQDVSNLYSSKYLQLNSCGILQKKINEMVTYRNKGRVDYHIIYILDGEFEVKFNGEVKLLKKGGFVIYPPNTPHWYKDFPGTLRIWIHLNGNNITEILNDANLSCGVYSAKFDYKLQQLLLNLIAVNNCKFNTSSENGLLLTAIYELGKLSNGVSDNNSRLNDCISYIVMNYNSDLNLQNLASMCNLSVSRFMSLFKSYVGVAPIEYQKTLRINNAKSLLTSTDLPIIEIANLCGYKDSLYFSRIFKKTIGVSPKTYRNLETKQDL